MTQIWQLSGLKGQSQTVDSAKKPDPLPVSAPLKSDPAIKGTAASKPIGTAMKMK